MARATAAKVLIRLGGDYPAGTDATAMVGFCAQADYFLDGYTYPIVLSTTDDIVIEICVSIVLAFIDLALWLQAGGVASGEPRPEILTEDIKLRIEQLLASETPQMDVGDIIGD